MNYNFLKYNDFQSFDDSDYLNMESFHWESDPPYRPSCFCKIGIVDNCLCASLKCYEVNPKAVYVNRDDPMYLDSCLEFFVAPLCSDNRYINVECNSKGAFLCEFGDGKYNRLLVKDITNLSPEVKAFKGNDSQGEFWGVNIILKPEFLNSVYKCDIKEFDFSSVKANFYKCGDDCEIQHYVALSPVTDLPPGFHNPKCFAEFKRSF